MGLFDFLKKTEDTNSKDFSLIVEDTFSIEGRGVVVCGEVALGEISVGDKVIINNKTYVIGGIEYFRKLIDKATVNMNVGLLLKGADVKDINRGDTVLNY